MTSSTVGKRLVEVSSPTLTHVPEDEYEAFLRRTMTPASATSMLWVAQRFWRRYPTFNDWLAESLEQRVGRLPGEGPRRREMTNSTSYTARRYLLYASITGRLKLPWDYLLSVEIRQFDELVRGAGHGWLADHLKETWTAAEQGGWRSDNAEGVIRFTIPRLVLRHANPDIAKSLTEHHFEALRGEIRDFYATSPDIRFRQRSTGAIADPPDSQHAMVYAAHAIYFQLGYVSNAPTRSIPGRREVTPTMQPEIQRAYDAWQAYAEAREMPLSTMRGYDLQFRYFATFLEQERPHIKTLSELKRSDALAFLSWLAEQRTTRKPHQKFSITTRRQTIATVSLILRELHENELAPCPGHSLFHSEDYPKEVKPLPRFIPRKQMQAVEQGIETLTDPYQRAAILIARWSGARRDEVQRLELDCLDEYDDGTPRIRIPAGKTRKERMIPLAEEAAEAIRSIQQLRAGDRDRGVIDRVTKRPVRYLFRRRGILLSKGYLFDSALLEVCKHAGLITEDGGKLVTAHRFRHTLGTDLVEKGARWRTIMKILGHESADMTMTYAHISDKEVKADYEKVIAAGAAIAGPAADAIRNQELSQDELDWLQSNFYKSEMELGACIRMPAEGPCECDLFLKCGKFFTTKEHAPRLRSRWRREEALIEDARQREWPREVERHRSIQTRLEELLADLGEPLEGPGCD